MAISINLGWSAHTNSYQAGKSAATDATKNWQEDGTNLGLVFASAQYNQYRLVAGIKEVISRIPIIGCSGAGVITPEGPIENGVIIAILGAEPSTFQYSLGLGKNVLINSREAGYQAARLATNNFTKLPLREKYKATRKSFIIFPDGVSGNGADILRGCQEVLGSNFPIIGGSAGDAYIFQKTYQYFPQGVTSGAVIGLLVGGDISLGIGVKHGWKPLGKYRKITKANANIIQEIDNQPAIWIYENYFGKETKILKEEPLSMMGMLYPIGMKISGGEAAAKAEEEYLVRYPCKIGKKGELICTAELPEGSKIRLMIGNRNSALMAAREAGLNALNGLREKQAKFVLMISSISRKRLLGRNCYKEIEVIRNIIGKGIPVMGFYSYGEQAPLTSEMYTGESYFHNEAIVVSIMGE